MTIPATGKVTISFKAGDLTYLDEDGDGIKTIDELEVAELRGGGGAGEIIGHAPATEKVRQLLAKVARSTLPVLIVGERGTGKELAASAIHRQSERAGAPFVAVNCAAIPEPLTESAFFGHRRGAFTGADRDQLGYFRQAEGGTLFLDEVADLRATAQAALLRALQQSEVLPVGETTPTAVDVRVVCATNRDLTEAASSEASAPPWDLSARFVALHSIGPHKTSRDAVAHRREFPNISSRIVLAKRTRLEMAAWWCKVCC